MNLGSPQAAWDVFEISQSDLHWERHLKDLLETFQKRSLFCDVFKASQIHQKMSFLRSLYDVSSTSQKRCLFCDLFKTSQIHLNNDVFYVTSLGCLKHISKKMFILWRLWYVSKIYLESICDYSKISHKNGFMLIK